MRNFHNSLINCITLEIHALGVVINTTLVRHACVGLEEGDASCWPLMPSKGSKEQGKNAHSSFSKFPFYAECINFLAGHYIHIKEVKEPTIVMR